MTLAAVLVAVGIGFVLLPMPGRGIRALIHHGDGTSRMRAIPVADGSLTEHGSGYADVKRAGMYFIGSLLALLVLAALV